MMSTRWAVENFGNSLGTHEVSTLLALIVVAADFAEISPLVMAAVRAIEDFRGV